MERCLAGHPDDFRHLVRRYQAVLLARLAGKLGNRDRAEEATQETLVWSMGKMRLPPEIGTAESRESRPGP